MTLSINAPCATRMLFPCLASAIFSPSPFAESTLRWQLYPPNIVCFMGRSYKSWWMQGNFRWGQRNVSTIVLLPHSTARTLLPDYSCSNASDPQKFYQGNKGMTPVSGRGGDIGRQHLTYV